MQVKTQLCFVKAISQQYTETPLASLGPSSSDVKVEHLLLSDNSTIEIVLGNDGCRVFLA